MSEDKDLHRMFEAHTILDNKRFDSIEKKLDSILAIIGGAKWGWKVFVGVGIVAVTVTSIWQFLAMIVKSLSGK